MTPGPAPRTLRVPPDVARVLRTLHPEIKTRIKEALRHLQEDPFAGKPLRAELEGLRSYRVARFRIVYRVAEDRILEIVAVGPRRTIYIETVRLLKKRVGR